MLEFLPFHDLDLDQDLDLAHGLYLSLLREIRVIPESWLPARRQLLLLGAS